MRRQREIAPLFVVVLSAALFAPAAGAASPVLFGTHGTVQRIAGDGNRVALETTTPGGCDRVVVWNEATKAYSSWATDLNCPGGGTSGGQSVTELALAATTAGWIEESAGDTIEDLTLATATVGHAKPNLSVLSHVYENGTPNSDPTGDWLGNLFGSGTLLAFNTWHVCEELPTGTVDEGEMSYCSTPSPTSQIVDVTQNPLLQTDIGGAVKTVASGPTSTTIVAVNGGRIAVQQSNGSVLLYSSTGALLNTISVTAGASAGTALSGTQLVTLGNGTLDVYDTASGTLTKSIPITAPKPTLRGASGGIAVYVSGTALHLVRLSDGKDVTIHPSGSAPVDAQITTSGLFYSYNVPTNHTAPGRVAFVSTANVVSLF
jgi:hypothetical protein